MTVYVDSSALLKRVVLEPESEALRASLRQRHDAGDLITSSSLCWVEVWRALARAVEARQVDRLGGIAVSGIAEFPLSDAVLARARHLGPRGLRTLDAIHLASAVAVGATELVTYDVRLADAAAAVGLVVRRPG